MNDNSYGVKNAYIFTILISVILFTPLFFYTLHMKSIHDIKNELQLKSKAYLILQNMNAFDTNSDYFQYPRFQTFRSGLYNINGTKIFSTIENEIPSLQKGYYKSDDNAYFILELPSYKYFNASYLIVENKLSYSDVYQKSISIGISIIVLIFLLSIVFLNWFAKPFKEINKQLDNFIKDSIHEINTPLSIININIDLFNKKFESNKYTNRVKAASKVLSNIYNDMDYLIKHDRVHYEKKSINMCHMLKERIDYFTEIALMKNINILSDIQTDIQIDINPKQLQTLIDNNISNAIKYSYEENIIKITLYAKDDSYYLEFKDYGIGIKDIDKIFTRYYREERQTGGFGIGLNIVKTIIDENNITLDIISEVKKGSTFTYKFPIKKI